MTSNSKELITNAARLEGLATLVEDLEGPDRRADAAIAELVHLKQLTYSSPEWIKDPEFTASLDAAMSLVPEWPNHGGYRLTRDDDLKNKILAEIWEHPDAEPGDGWHRARGATMALAVCAAALRARATQSPVDEGE